MGHDDQRNSRAVRTRRTRRGFTLLEVMISAAILAVAISGICGSMLSALALDRVNRETTLARSAARRLLEEARGVPFAEIFATYNASTADDVGLTNPARGANFAVDGLDPATDDADGICGRVMFPTIAVGALEELREDSTDAALGMPRDLNGDGPDVVDHAGDYNLLPIRARVEWNGISGRRRFDLETMVCEL